MSKERDIFVHGFHKIGHGLFEIIDSELIEFTPQIWCKMVPLNK